MIKQCLKSFPEDRPSIQQVVQLLEQARDNTNSAVCHMDRLALLERVASNEQQITSSNQRFRAMEQQIVSQTMEAQAMKQEITDLRMKHHELVQQQRTQTAEVVLLNQQMALVEQQRESQQAEIEQLRAQARVSFHSKKIQPWYTCMVVLSCKYSAIMLPFVPTLQLNSYMLHVFIYPILPMKNVECLQSNE